MVATRYILKKFPEVQEYMEYVYITSLTHNTILQTILTRFITSILFSDRVHKVELKKNGGRNINEKQKEELNVWFENHVIKFKKCIQRFATTIRTIRLSCMCVGCLQCQWC